MDPELVAFLRGELGPIGQQLLDIKKMSEERSQQLDARLAALETGGTAGAARTRYAQEMHDGRPTPMRRGENVEEFIERLRQESDPRVRYVNVAGVRLPLIENLPRGVPSGTDGRGIMFARMVRAMALSVARSKSASYDDAIDAARAAWGADDPVLGHLEETRDLIRDLEGSDHVKRAFAARALGTTTVGGGASLIGPTQAGPFVDFLHAMAVMRRLGATSMPLNATSITMPYFDVGAAISYRDEGTGPNESSPGDGNLELLRKLLGGAVAINNELLAESSFAVDILVRDHLARQLAAYADKKMILGRGNQGEIRGLDWWVELPTTAHTGNRNLSGGVPTYKTILKDLTVAFQVVTDENKQVGRAEGARPGVLCSNREFWAFMRVTDAQDRRPFYDEVRAGTLLGADLAASTQMPTNLVGDGAGAGVNNKSKMFIGDYSSFLIAESEGLSVQAFPGGTYKDATGTMQSGITNRQTVITIDQSHDTADKYRGKSFYRVDSVDIGAQF